jgi:hypothetical protein
MKYIFYCIEFILIILKAWDLLRVDSLSERYVTLNSLSMDSKISNLGKPHSAELVKYIRSKFGRPPSGSANWRDLVIPTVKHRYKLRQYLERKAGMAPGFLKDISDNITTGIKYNFI